MRPPLEQVLQCAAKDPVVSSIGIPQGDAASPLILALTLAKGVADVQALAPVSQLFQSVYMDARFIAAASRPLLLAAINKWAEFSSSVHLVENPSKLQTCDLQDEPGGYMEVLGCIIGAASRQTFYDHPKNTDRLLRAKNTARRVGFLPLRVEDKISNLGIFARSQAAYGWISGRAPAHGVTNYDSTLWKAAGKFAFGVPKIKTIISGCHMELAHSVFLSQLRTLVFRREVLARAGHSVRNRLDEMVLEQLEHFGWFENGMVWFHQDLDCQFEWRHILDDKSWKRISHFLRQSFRWRCYTELADCDRRELRGVPIPPFNEERINLARRWSSLCRGNYSLSIGAVPSAGMRSIVFESGKNCGLAVCARNRPRMYYCADFFGQGPVATCLCVQPSSMHLIE
eukprot:Skav217258  [mRNA]  locus=scaffold47:990272:991468:+ [translate_table: standard]